MIFPNSEQNGLHQFCLWFRLENRRVRHLRKLPRTWKIKNLKFVAYRAINSSFRWENFSKENFVLMLADKHKKVTRASTAYQEASAQLLLLPGETPAPGQPGPGLSRPQLYRSLKYSAFLGFLAPFLSIVKSFLLSTGTWSLHFFINSCDFYPLTTRNLIFIKLNQFAATLWQLARKIYYREFFFWLNFRVGSRKIRTRKAISGQSKKRLIGRACLCQNPKTKRSSGPENLGHLFKVGAAHT